MLALALFVSPKGAVASDFSPIMWLLLIPFAVFAGLVFLATLLCTRHMKRPWAITTIRIAVGCMVLTPTYTRGGNGQSLSVAGYDILLSAFGGDPVYAAHAMANAGVATLALLALLWASKRFR